MNGERIAFENWLGIKPCGAAHDLAWAAWQARASLPATQQATPEPGLLKTFLAEADRAGITHLPATFAADLASATPPQQAAGEPVAQVSDLFPSVRNKLHAQGFDSDAPLFTHPAPGVPEGFDVQAHVATGGGHEYPLITVCDTSTQVGEDVFPDEHPVIYGLLSALLAADQAKGEQE